MAVLRAVLQGQAALEGDRVEYTVKFVDEDGADVALSSADVDDLTGYDLADGDEEALDAADSLNVALAKLEARIVALEAP